MALKKLVYRLVNMGEFRVLVNWPRRKLVEPCLAAEYCLP
jgi:hypothetical protein